MNPYDWASISYNCYPGWGLRGAVRHVLRQGMRAENTAVENVRRARRLAETLADAMTGDGGAIVCAMRLALLVG